APGWARASIKEVNSIAGPQDGHHRPTRGDPVPGLPDVSPDDFVTEGERETALTLGGISSTNTGRGSSSGTGSRARAGIFSATARTFPPPGRLSQGGSCIPFFPHRD